MSARDEHLAEVLCYCPDTQELPEDGHPLGTPGCASEIKVGRYHDGWCRRDHYGVSSCPNCHSPGYGTCPECGKRVRVARYETRVVDGQLVMGVSNAQDPDHGFKTRGPRLQVQPGVVAHKVKGEPCSGEGQVPTETTYSEGRALQEWKAAQARGAA